MAGKSRRKDALDFEKAACLLEEHWRVVSAEAAAKPDLRYVESDALCRAIRESINHGLVSYRFCLPVQLLGKILNPALNCLRLQKSDPEDAIGWDARSLASKVVAVFNRKQESILGTSADPYVGNPMRIPEMVRDDQSKKDIPGWNRLVEILEQVESNSDPTFTSNVFRQVMLEMFRRQQSLRFSYPIPPRVGLELVLSISAEFLSDKSGGDRPQALAGALLDAIGIHFGLFAQVNRARINASDEATGQAADLECFDKDGKLVLAVEVKDRTVTLADIEGTLHKSRQRQITEILFTAKGAKPEEKDAIGDRIARAFAAGQNLYIFDFFRTRS